MLLSPLAMKSLITIEKVLLRMTIANFHGNSSSAVISCGSPTIASKAKNDFYRKLSVLVRAALKHNVLIIGGDFNANI